MSFQAKLRDELRAAVHNARCSIPNDERSHYVVGWLFAAADFEHRERFTLQEVIEGNDPTVGPMLPDGTFWSES